MDVRNRGTHQTGVPKTTTAAQAQRPVSAVAPQNMAASNDKKSKKKRKWPLFLIGIVVVVAVLIGGYFAKQVISPSPINKDKFQAVFLTNGQVYFGRLSVVNDQYLKLSGVFYIQSQESTTSGEQAAEDAAGMQLIKLGEEVHGPEDAMMINRDQMLFFENLKSDGKVTQLIQQHNKGGN